MVDPRLQQTGTVTFLLATVPDNTGTTAIGRRRRCRRRRSVRTRCGRSRDGRAEADDRRVRQHVLAVGSICRCGGPGDVVRASFVDGGDRVRGCVHVADDGDVHDHGRSADQQTGSLTFLDRRCGQHGDDAVARRRRCDATLAERTFSGPGAATLAESGIVQHGGVRRAGRRPRSVPRHARLRMAGSLPFTPAVTSRRPVGDRSRRSSGRAPALAHPPAAAGWTCGRRTTGPARRTSRSQTSR